MRDLLQALDFQTEIEYCAAARQALETPDMPNRNRSCEDHAMASKALPSPEVLRQLLRYEPETGKLFWRERGPEWFAGKMKEPDHLMKAWNSNFAGKEAMTAECCGHRSGSVLMTVVRAHRVIWAIAHGRWPVDQIDHINGKRNDNRIENLREVCAAENSRNMKTPKNNSSGVIGVSALPHGRWAARINHESRNYNLGSFAKIADAVAARKAGEVRFGYHPNHGRIAHG